MPVIVADIEANASSYRTADGIAVPISRGDRRWNPGLKRPPRHGRAGQIISLQKVQRERPNPACWKVP